MVILARGFEFRQILVDLKLFPGLGRLHLSNTDSKSMGCCSIERIKFLAGSFEKSC